VEPASTIKSKPQAFCSGNGIQVIVRSVCLQKFLGIRVDKIFDAIERIEKDPTASMNAETIDYSYQKGWITLEEDYLTYRLLRGRKKLSGKGLQKRIEINRQILQCFRSTYGKPNQK